MANTNFRFRMNTDLHFGEGILKRADEIIRPKGFKKMAIVVDKNVSALPGVSGFIDLMKNSFSVEVFENPSIEPDYDFLEVFRGNFKADLDCIVGLGGGSTIDLAKAMAVLAVNEGPAIDFKGFPEIKNKPLPVVAVPTLAGTGSEIAYNAVFTDSKKKNRLGINTELNYPVLTIVDPVLSLTAPKSAFISGALDCIGHILESYISEGASVFTRELSKSAFSLWYKAIDALADDLNNITARSELFLASIFANMALNNAGGGLGGSFSYPLGALHNVPHGIGEGIFIPYLVRCYVDKGFTGYSELYDLIPESVKGISDQEKNQQFCDYLDKIYKKLNPPVSLNEFGLERKDIPVLVSQIEGAFHECPVEFKEDDARQLFEHFIK